MRFPSAEGIYYPKDPNVLKIAIQDVFNLKKTKSPKSKAQLVIVPNDRYENCGRLLGNIYSQIQIPQNVIILGDSHEQIGNRWAIDTRQTWLTPLGKIDINHKLSNFVMENCPFLRKDDLAHLNEHAIEVQLPYLQSVSKKTQMVPLLLQELSTERSHRLATALIKTTRQFEEPVLIIASLNIPANEKENISTFMQSTESATLRTVASFLKLVKLDTTLKCVTKDQYLAVFI